MALKNLKLPQMANAIWSTSLGDQERRESAIVDGELMMVMSEVQKTLSASSKAKKDSDQKAKKVSAYKKLRALAVKEQIKILDKRKRDYAVLAKKLQDAKSNLAVTKVRLDDFQRHVKSKLESATQQKTLYEAGIDKLIRSAPSKLAPMQWNSKEMEAEVGTIKETVKDKLDDLKSYLCQLVRDFNDAKRLQSMMVQMSSFPQYK